MAKPTREEELRMMQDFTEWPQWPLLPIVNRSEGACGESGFPSARVLIALPDPKDPRGDGTYGRVDPVTYKANLWAFVEVLAAAGGDYREIAKEEFDSFEAIIDAGWEVD